MKKDETTKKKRKKNQSRNQGEKNTARRSADKPASSTNHLVDDLEAEGDGLLAEDGLASLSRRDDLPRVLVGGGANHDGLYIGVVDELRGRGRWC